MSVQTIGATLEVDALDKVFTFEGVTFAILVRLDDDGHAIIVIAEQTPAGTWGVAANIGGDATESGVAAMGGLINFIRFLVARINDWLSTRFTAPTTSTMTLAEQIDAEIQKITFQVSSGTIRAVY